MATANDTIETILKKVGKDGKKALAAYKDERNGKNRKSLIDQLKPIIANSLKMPKWGVDKPANEDGARYQMAASTLETFKSTKAFKNAPKFINTYTLPNGKVRVYTRDHESLTAVANALDEAADELFDVSLNDFKTMLRAANLARQQADVAKNLPEPEAKPKTNGKAKTKKVDADADAIVDEVVPF